MSEIVISSEKAGDFTSGVRIICRVCEKQFSQYTCPRCNTRYCSMHCYKSHSLRCTESFMRENVMEELHQTQPDEESRLRMMDILKRLHEEEETDNFDEEDVLDSGSSLSEETIQKALSGDSICFNNLSVEEKKCFKRAVASGELSKLIEPWDPWWLKPSARNIGLSSVGTRLVEPVNSSETSENDTSIPLGPETALPPLMKLTSTAPSPLLSIHLVDIIYSYCFTLRLYNGDWKVDALEASNVCFSISSVLGEGAKPETVLEALVNCLEQTCSAVYREIGGLQFGLSLVDDVTCILHLGGAALICLLCDLQRLIQAAEREVKLERKGKMKMVESRSKLKSANRKIYFLMCWVHEQSFDIWSSLAALVNAEKASLSVQSAKVSKSGHQTDTRGKPMITEI